MSVKAVVTIPIEAEPTVDGYSLVWNNSDGYWEARPNVVLPFGPSQYIVPPPPVASWDIQYNPVPHIPLDWGAANIIDHPTGHGLLVEANGVTTHDAFAGIFMNRGSNVRWTILLDAVILDTLNGNSGFIGMNLYDSVANRGITFGVGFNGGGTNLVMVVLRKDYAAWSSTAPIVTPIYKAPPIWLQIFDDGVNLNFYYCYDGVTFSQVFSESRTAFLSSAGDHVGVGVEVINSSSPIASENHASLWLGSWSASLT